VKAPDFMGSLGTLREVKMLGKYFTSSYIFMTSSSPD
jgi:hypothetical protein